MTVLLLAVWQSAEEKHRLMPAATANPLLPTADCQLNGVLR